MGKPNEIEKLIRDYWKQPLATRNSDKWLKRRLQAFGKAVYWKGRHHESVNSECRDAILCRKLNAEIQELFGFKP